MFTVFQYENTIFACKTDYLGSGCPSLQQTYFFMNLFIC